MGGGVLNRFLSRIGLLAALTLMMGCSLPFGRGGYYDVYTNFGTTPARFVTSVSTVRSIEALEDDCYSQDLPNSDDIIGVLLKYTLEGAYSQNVYRWNPMPSVSTAYTTKLV